MATYTLVQYYVDGYQCSHEVTSAMILIYIANLDQSKEVAVACSMATAVNVYTLSSDFWYSHPIQSLLADFLWTIQ